MFNHISVDVLVRIAELACLPEEDRPPPRAGAHPDTTMRTRRRRLTDSIAALSPEARLELIAAMLVGRGEFAAGEWFGAITRARAIAGSGGVERIAGKPHLDQHLKRGLEALRLAEAPDDGGNPPRTLLRGKGAAGRSAPS